MKKLYNILLTILFTFIALFLMQTHSSANTIYDINMDVYIDSAGNATITEVWNTNLNQGTEGYRPFTKLGNSIIYNFNVTDKTGRIYQSLSSWDINANFDSKSYKNGIHYIPNGVELCWGISNYGNNTYTLKYNISNFITQYTDTQGLYFNFIDLDQSVKNATIVIHSDYDFSLDNSKIWSFGNKGTINFENGNIVLKSNGYLSSSQYMVALVRFEENLFNTSNTSTKSFDTIYNSAMNGVTDISEQKYFSNLTDKHIKLLIFCLFIILLICFLPIFFLLPCKYKSNRKNNNIEYAPLNLGKKIKKNEVSYFREIPCNGDLYYAYWLMIKYNILKENECKNGLLGAILLQWIKEGYIELSQSPKGLFNLKNNKYSIIFKVTDISNIKFQNTYDRNLMQMLIQASGSNNILEADEFKNWCKKNYNFLNSWFNTIIQSKTTNLQQKRLIFETIENRNKSGQPTTIITKHVDTTVRNEAIHLIGLKQFLLDYSLVSEKQNLEVHLLENYLIFAQLLGIADKIEKQFSKLYPDFNEISNITNKTSCLYSRELALNITSIIINEKLKYEKQMKREIRRNSISFSNSYSGSSRDSGGGGSSYSSGGRSSGGSSGGGFR